MIINRKIFTIALILVGGNCFSESILSTCNNSHLIISNKYYDTTKIETNSGFIEIINECDSNSSMLEINGWLNDSSLNKTSEESEKLNINLDKGFLIFELNSKGQLIICKIGKPPKLKEFNILLQQFATEINKKYKDKTIIICNNNLNMNYNYLEVPLSFQMIE